MASSSAAQVGPPMKPLPTDLAPAGGLTGPVRCLVCDIYGTLFISGSGDIGTARPEERPWQKIEDLLAGYQVRWSASDLLRNLNTAITAEHERAVNRGVDCPEVQIDQIWQEVLPFKEASRVRKFAVDFEMVVNPVWPMPGLKNLLETCRLSGICLGIISNAQFYTPDLFQWYLDEDLETLGFDPRMTFFSYVHGRAKPSPYLFQLAADELKKRRIPVNHAAYIGNDKRNDITPARDMGFQTVLFAGDARSLRLREDDPHCAHIEPDLQITHLNQLASRLVQV